MKDIKQIWTVEPVYTWERYDQFNSLEEARTQAQAKAWREGNDQWIMSAVGLARKPELVNTVKVDAID